MVILGVVGDDNRAATASNTAVPECLHKAPEGCPLNLSVSQPDGREVPNASPCRAESTLDSASHAVGSAPRRSPTSLRNRRPSALEVFFRLLPFRIRLRDRRPGFAQAEAQLPEYALALPRPQLNLIFPINPGSQAFPVPKGTNHINFSRGAPQDRIDSLKLHLIESPRPPAPLALQQSR